MEMTVLMLKSMRWQKDLPTSIQHEEMSASQFLDLFLMSGNCSDGQTREAWTARTGKATSPVEGLGEEREMVTGKEIDAPPGTLVGESPAIYINSP